MSEHKIPDDLREDYDDFAEASNSPMEGGWRYYARTLIERIARVEAERDEYALSDSILRKAYEESGQSSRLTWSGWLHEVVRENAQLRAALARMQEPVTSIELVLIQGNRPTKSAQAIARECRRFADALLAARAAGRGTNELHKMQPANQ